MLKETPQEPADDELFIGNNASAIVIANWRRTLQKGTFSVGIFGATNSFDNHTIIGTNLENGTNDQVLSARMCRSISPGPCKSNRVPSSSTSTNASSVTG